MGKGAIIPLYHADHLVSCFPSDTAAITHQVLLSLLRPAFFKILGLQTCRSVFWLFRNKNKITKKIFFFLLNSIFLKGPIFFGSGSRFYIGIDIVKPLLPVQYGARSWENVHIELRFVFIMAWFSLKFVRSDEKYQDQQLKKINLSCQTGMQCMCCKWKGTAWSLEYPMQKKWNSNIICLI